MSSLDEKSLVGTIPEEDGRDLSSAKPLKSSASDEQAIAQFGKRQRFNVSAIRIERNPNLHSAEKLQCRLRCRPQYYDQCVLIRDAELLNAKR